MGNPLLDLKAHGQSIWYDNLNRELIATGRLQKMVDGDGVSGGTSNPSIFEKAINGTSYYDDDLMRLTKQRAGVDEAYDDLTVTDVGLCADVFRPVYEAANGHDGLASLEVSPDLAYETERTIADAHRLWDALGRPNAMIKIPGTQEGLPAVERCLADGLNINITLLFGVENYEQVALTYISALEKRVAAGQPIDRIASVASFFVSRVDSLVDSLLQQKIDAAGDSKTKDDLKSLMGKAGVANAKIAYEKFAEIFSTARWKALAAKGARVQRCLWASTSTKNPDYNDVMYVDELIGPDTVNTLPQSTLDAFRDHGKVARTLDKGLDEAHALMGRLADAGIDFKAVTDQLQTEGVQLFCDSFNKANETIAKAISERIGAS
jgi:transaldolase